MKPASTGSMKPKAAPPVSLKNFASGVFEPNDERQHVADAVHQVLVDLAADALACRIVGTLDLIRTAGVIDRCFAGQRAVDELVGLVDAVGHLRDDDVLAVEAAHGHVLIGGDDDAVCRGDLSVREDVLRAAGAVRLDLDGDAAFLRVLLKALGCHEGMGNARRAGRDGQHLDVVGRGCSRLLRGSCRSLEPARFLVVDELQELVLIPGGDQGLLEVWIHDHGRELREDSQMLIIGRVRGRDHEEQAGRVAVHGLEVHALRHGHGREAGGLDARALGVRRGDAVAEARRALGFARQDILLVLIGIAEVARGIHELSQLADCRLLVFRMRAQHDTLALEQFRNAHIFLSFLYMRYFSGVI